MEAGLAAKFPEMRSFAGQGMCDRYATIRFDFNPYFGFSAQILSAVTGRIFIDPYVRGDVNYYMSYFARDVNRSGDFVCNVKDNLIDNPNPANIITAWPTQGLPNQINTYRPGSSPVPVEYSVAVAGSDLAVPLVAAAMNTAMTIV